MNGIDTNNLQPYSLTSPCPKCYSHADTTYSPPVMLRTCRCGYQWEEAPLDAVERKPPERLSFWGRVGKFFENMEFCP